MILRGANSGPNYSAAHIKDVSEKLNKSNLPARIMVDCSHGNSEKKHENQMKVVDSLSEQLSAGDAAAFNIVGVMLESNLEEGKSAGTSGYEVRRHSDISVLCCGIAHRQAVDPE